MHNETWASIQIDVKNAFNSASRAHTLTQIAMHIPEMYNYILSMYRLQHKLWMNVPDEQLRTHIIAGEGSPQGAVDGSFFFTLAINYILVKMNGLVKENGGGVFVAISDDVTGKGNPTAIAISVIYMLQQFAKLGLTVNITKSTIYSQHQHIIDELLRVQDMPQDWKTTTSGFKLLGFAISHSKEYLAEVFSEKCIKFDKTIEAITEFGKSYLQQGLHLLKSCYMSKYSYLSRVTTPDVSIPFLKLVMEKVRNSLDRMISIHLTDGQ
jgi:hypothetical protein